MITRRRAIKNLTGAVALSAATGAQMPHGRAVETSDPRKSQRIRQSVIHWCFKGWSVLELADAAASLGMQSVELVAAEFWPELKKRGLICAMTPSHGFAKGFAHREEHDECLEVLRKRIVESAAAWYPNVITFSGFRRGLSTEEGMTNMVAGLKQIAAYAEKNKVNVCLEMLNSRVRTEMKGHPDYFCDNIEMAVDICRQVGSERIKVLFDIYHVQIMHGDVIERIRRHHPFIGHYHTAGVPGRGELDDTQELNYPPIMKEIVATGYRGYVGQEFIPTRDKMTGLREAFLLCDV